MTHTTFDEGVAELAKQQANAFARHQVKALGGTEKMVEVRLGSGCWRCLARAVYSLRDGPFTWMTRVWAGLLEAGVGSAISHRTAGRLHGLWAFRNHEAIEVIKKGGRDHDITFGRVHETSILDPHHVILMEGLPVTSLGRTLFDLAGSPPDHLRGERGREIYFKKLLSVYNDAMKRCGLRLDRVAQVALDLGKRGRPGTVLTRELLGAIDPDEAPTESELEDLFLAVLRAYQVELPVRQKRLGNDEAFIGRVDFVYVAAKLVVEIDGRGHGAPLDTDADSWRDIELNAQGWTVFRFTRRQLLFEPARVAGVI
ncbi:MAG: endonuclease domain-containing protein, partial [Acidimicrobiales bacterium]